MYDSDGMTTGDGQDYDEKYLNAAVTEWNSTTQSEECCKVYH